MMNLYNHWCNLLEGKTDYSDVNEKKWAKFGSWHNKYPEGTKFKFNGNKWIPENKQKEDK